MIMKSASYAGQNSQHTRNKPARHKMPLISCFYYPIYLFIIFIHHVSGQQQSVIGGNQLDDAQYHQHNNILYFSIEENKPPGSYVGTIRSADGQVPSMNFANPPTPENEQAFKQAFSVNKTTGDITTVSSLDREQREQYEFVALVTNPTGEVKCTVTVKDANDNVPMFLTDAINETNYVINVPEGEKGVRRALPWAVDFDKPGVFGIREFRIMSGNTPSCAFTLVQHGAPINPNITSRCDSSSLADETTNAMLKDAGNPHLIRQIRNQETVLIPNPMHVAPGFSLSTSLGSMPAALQQRVARAESKFLIDLEVSQILDRENQSSYQILIEVVDSGEQVGLLNVTVNVQDVNDNDPIFMRPSYEFHVREDSLKLPLLVGRVEARDNDIDSNGQVSYYLKRHTASSQQLNSRSAPAASKGLISGSQRSNVVDVGPQSDPGKLRSGATYGSDQLFDVEPSKGEIYLVNPLDFETDQWHELLIEARDHGRPSRSSFATVKIFVTDIPDDQPTPGGRSPDERRGSSVGSSSLASMGDPNGSRAESSTRSNIGDTDPSNQHGLNLMYNFNFEAWYAQMTGLKLFLVVLGVLMTVMFPVCFVKIKSRQPESDYNDTAGLTNQLSPGNGQTKPSPSHSASNMDHPNGMLGGEGLHHHHHHHDHVRRMGGESNMGLGSSAKMMGRHYFNDSSSNHYHNPYPPQQRARHHSSTSHHHLLADSPAEHHHHHHQMPLGGGSRGGTMTLSHNHHHAHHHLAFNHTPPGHHNSLEHPHSHGQFAGANLATGSLTYDHSHAVLMHHQAAAAAHHHQSLHQLSPLHQVALSGVSHLGAKGDTMNSMGTHNSAQHQASSSPISATPNTTHSSVIQAGATAATMPHDPSGLLQARRNPLLPSLPQPGHHQSSIGQQTPTTPTQNSGGCTFSWAPAIVQGPGSTIGCYPGEGNGLLGNLHEALGSTVDSCSSPTRPATPQPLDRWLDSSSMPQVLNSQDWCGTYNWDYLVDWHPEYNNLMPLIEAEAAPVTIKAPQ